MALYPSSSIEPLSRASSVFDGPIYEHNLLTRVETTIPRVSSPPSVPPSLQLRANYLSSYLIVSGGTGCNSICSAFPQERTCYVLPVSDDGGSSSEIIRVIGGPSIGDIRSRLIRLIPSSQDSAGDAIRNLLAYRFPASWSEKQARESWRDVVEGRSGLWKGIPGDRKELIRGFLVYFESEVLKRAHKNFSFRNGSIGNFFLSAAQLFFRSLPSAIFQFSSITGSQGTILPVLVTNHTVTIAAQLSNGQKLVGQCEISHPVAHNVQSEMVAQEEEENSGILEGLEDDIEILPMGNVHFDKGEVEPLAGRIERVFYINAYGQEIYPSPNPEFIANLHRREYLVYSCGSLWTSIIPCLALRGIASAIAQSSSLKAKILLLNAKNDRETTSYTALDYISAITNTLNRHNLTPRMVGRVQGAAYPPSAFVTHLIYLSDTSIEVETNELAEMGIKCMAMRNNDGGGFDAQTVRAALELI